MKARVVVGAAIALIVVSCSGSGAEEATVPSTPPEASTPLNTSPASTTAPASALEAGITIQDFSFGEPLVVGAGAMVTVVNSDPVSHTWTSRDNLFDSGSLSQGAEFSFKFDKAGEYQFFCSIHPTMAGSITVEG